MKYENCNSFVFELSDGQILKVRQHLESSGWDFSNPPNTRWKAVKDRVNLAAYNSGKVCIQGKGAYEFVIFILEPENFPAAQAVSTLIPSHSGTTSQAFVPLFSISPDTIK